MLLKLGDLSLLSSNVINNNLTYTLWNKEINFPSKLSRTFSRSANLRRKEWENIYIFLKWKLGCDFIKNIWTIMFKKCTNLQLCKILFLTTFSNTGKEFFYSFSSYYSEVESKINASGIQLLIWKASRK